MGIIYCATLKSDGRRYIGKSLRTLNERRKEHLKLARGKATTYFHRALKKYGCNAFDWEVIRVCPDTELDTEERFFIALFNSNGCQGFNLTEGGEGCTHSDEIRHKISSANKGRKMTEVQIAGSQRWRTDPDRALEVYAKISATLTGRPGVKGPNGRKASEETRRKMSEAHKGRVRQKGYHLSAETRSKMSKAHQGKPKGPTSDETKRKISESKLRKSGLAPP